MTSKHWGLFVCEKVGKVGKLELDLTAYDTLRKRKCNSENNSTCKDTTE